VRELLTPRQVALAIGVSEASLKRWCDKGLLPAIRTAGGHRRLPLNGVLDFLRRSGRRVVRPQVLGLPSPTGKGEANLDRGRARVRSALESGDEEQVLRLAHDLYLAGHRICDICDRVLAGAFHDLGQRWEHGDIEVYQERRGVEITRRVLHRLRMALPDVPDSAPLAFGGTLAGDPYTLASSMAEIVLREAGWRAESYGSGHPAATLRAALNDLRPRLFWLSISTIPSVEEFLLEYSSLYETAVSLGIPIAVGGRGLGEELRREMQYSAYCDTLRHLVSFARTL